jgi:hypothetical protein
MPGTKELLFLGAGMSIGALAIGIVETRAVAQAGSSVAVWQLGVESGGSVAWRMNTASGYMEVCSAPALQARCTVMPKPQGS